MQQAGWQLQVLPMDHPNGLGLRLIISAQHEQPVKMDSTGIK